MKMILRLFMAGCLIASLANAQITNKSLAPALALTDTNAHTVTLMASSGWTLIIPGGGTGSAWLGLSNLVTGVGLLGGGTSATVTINVDTNSIAARAWVTGQIAALNLGSAATHSASDFDSAGAANLVSNTLVIAYATADSALSNYFRSVNTVLSNYFYGLNLATSNAIPSVIGLPYYPLNSNPSNYLPAVGNASSLTNTVTISTNATPLGFGRSLSFLPSINVTQNTLFPQTYYIGVDSSVTNGFVTASVTNGLQVAGAYVTASITNGLLSPAATNGFVSATITNGLMANNSGSLVAAGAITNVIAPGGDMFYPSNTVTLTNGIATINEPLRTNGLTASSVAIVNSSGGWTNRLLTGGDLPGSVTSNLTFDVGLLPGASLCFYSTNDAQIVAAIGANSYWDTLQFSDTSIQQARWVIPANRTARYKGGAITNEVWWYGITTANSNVVWEISMIGRSVSNLMDVAYQNVITGTNTISSTLSNLVVTTIIFTPTNCTAGQLWNYQLRRLATNASDTLVSNASVVEVDLKE